MLMMMTIFNDLIVFKRQNLLRKYYSYLVRKADKKLENKYTFR